MLTLCSKIIRVYSYRMARWMPVLVTLSLCLVMMDVIVCPPVTDKPLPSTPEPENDEEVVSTQCTVLSLSILCIECRQLALQLPSTKALLFLNPLQIYPNVRKVCRHSLWPVGDVLVYQSDILVIPCNFQRRIDHNPLSSSSSVLCCHLQILPAVSETSCPHFFFMDFLFFHHLVVLVCKHLFIKIGSDAQSKTTFTLD